MPRGSQTSLQVGASWVSFFQTAVVALALGVLPTGDVAAGGQQATTGNVSGRVLDGRVGDPLPGALIRVEDTGRQTVSDSAGRFHLARLPAGELTLVVGFLGRLTVRTPVNVLAGQTVTFDVELVDELVLEESVIVRASAIGDADARALNQQKTAPNITNVVSADQLGRFPDANAAEATQRIPGVAIERDKGEGRYVMIRGTEPRLSSMMINGERIPSPENDVLAPGVSRVGVLRRRI